ncbi:MAG: endolytic transglycosylase MltG [Minisyncoccia bacterium]
MSRNSFISFIFALVLIFLYFVLISLPYPESINQEVVFSVQKGESLKEISLNLAKQKIIISSFLFNFYLKLNRLEKNIKAGDYIVNLPISLKDLAIKLTSNNVDSVFLIKEGETLKEIEDNLKEKGFLKNEESLSNFKLKDFKDFALKFNLNNYLDKPLEGFIFPDSYHLTKGMSASEIITIFLDNFSKKIGSYLKDKISSQEKNFYEILTLASLIEKEVKEIEDKRMVADILLRRLQTEMLLQVDATICYTLNQGFYNCQLKKDDFKIDSPYNTYLYQGLPPTPIANPSKETIEAVLNPIKNDYWYYLTNRKTGKTIFSKTYEEHQQACAHYL